MGSQFDVNAWSRETNLIADENKLRRPSRFKMCAHGEWKTIVVNDTSPPPEAGWNGAKTFAGQVENAISKSFWEIFDLQYNNDE